MKRYQLIAIAINSRLRCESFNHEGSHDEVIAQWDNTLNRLLEDLPHGSGFDRGCERGC